MEKIYICECGETFTDPQVCNGHKARCRIHLGEEKYAAFLERAHQQGLLYKQRAEERRKKKNEELKIQWLQERHICEKCGKIMIEKFGSGRFCSTTCAKSHVKWDKTAPELQVTCKYCGKIFYKSYVKEYKQYCSVECKNKQKNADARNKYEEYLKDNSIIYGKHGISWYKKIFLEEQHHKCAICGNSDTWNEKTLTLILDHIDGNADNNNRDNLRLICPNCDSQLPTYKSKNKNSARATWYKKD